MTIYAKTDGEVSGVFRVDHFDESAESPGEDFIEVVTGWPLPPRTNSWEVPLVQDGNVFWGDTRELADVIVGNVLAVDALADASRASVVGDGVRVKEYERAQQHAEAYQASGWALEPVPSSVASWAAAKDWSAQQAAEDILAASARWYAALDYIRALRLKAKEDIRNSTSNAQADTILATFRATLTAAMAGVQ